jgi:hypothetical protein
MVVYGNMLAAFPELIKPYKVFQMRPVVVGGYSERFDERIIRGYWSWRKLSKEEEQGGLKTQNYQAVFWAEDGFNSGKSKIVQSDFVEVNEKIFRVIDDQDFIHEGGFTKCLMQILSSTTDQQVSNKMVDKAIKDDY